MLGISTSRAVLIDPLEDEVRTGPNVEGRVYYRNEEGSLELSDNEVPYPEGAVLMHPSFYARLMERLEDLESVQP